MYPVNPFNPYQAINPAYIPSNLPQNAHAGNFNQITRSTVAAAQKPIKWPLTAKYYC